MSTSFPTLYNNFTCTVATARTAGSTTLVVTPTPSIAIPGFARLTISRVSGSTETVLCHLRATALTGSTFTIGGTLDGTTDVNLLVGDTVSVRCTAETLNNIQTAINSVETTYAPLASPALTGTPSAPTPLTSDNSTTVATTAYVKSQGYLTSAPVTSVAGRTGVVTLSTSDISGLGTIATHATSEYLATANNLSEVTPATARTNLGLGTAAVKASSGSGGTVASVSGTFTTGHLATFADTSGTVQDGGSIPSYSTFVASGASHAGGLVPDPGVTSGTTKFLREDATFAVPSASVAIGGAVGSATAKSVLYVDGSGNLAQDNSNLAYDGTNHQLTIGNPTSAAANTNITIRHIDASGVYDAIKILKFDQSQSVQLGWTGLFGASGLTVQTGGALLLQDASGTFLQGTGAGNAVVGLASRTTSSTSGFPYIPIVAGTPTGTPTAITGFAPIMLDSTAGKLWAYYGSAWHFTTLT